MSPRSKKRAATFDLVDAGKSRGVRLNDSSAGVLELIVALYEKRMI